MIKKVSDLFMVVYRILKRRCKVLTSVKQKKCIICGRAYAKLCTKCAESQLQDQAEKNAYIIVLEEKLVKLQYGLKNIWKLDKPRNEYLKGEIK